MSLAETREGVAKIGNGFSRYYGVVWGLIYVGDCLIYVGDCVRDLAEAMREQHERVGVSNPSDPHDEGRPDGEVRGDGRRAR